MNRGKTALRRGVAVASAAAIAIAGAVLAAPAASAWTEPIGPMYGGMGTGPNLTDIVRATPIADAQYVALLPDGSTAANDPDEGHTGSAHLEGASYQDFGQAGPWNIGSYNGHNWQYLRNYGGTGVAPMLNVGGNAQAGSGIQIKLPIETVRSDAGFTCTAGSGTTEQTSFDPDGTPVYWYDHDTNSSHNLPIADPAATGCYSDLIEGDGEVIADHYHWAPSVPEYNLMQMATWRPGDQLVVSLPQGVTFAATPTVGNVQTGTTGTGDTPTPVYGLVHLNDMSKLAGYSGQNALGAAIAHPLSSAINSVQATAAPAVTVALSSDNTKAILTFTNNQWGQTAASQSGFYDRGRPVTSAGDTALYDFDDDMDYISGDGGYLLSLGNVQLDVSQDVNGGAVQATVSGRNTNEKFGTSAYATTPANTTISPICPLFVDGANSDVSYVGGATTIGWVIPVSLTVTGSPLMPNNDGVQPLGDVTINELVKNALQDGTYTLTGRVLDSEGGHTDALDFDQPNYDAPQNADNAVATGTGGLTGGSFLPSGPWTGSPDLTNTITFTVGGKDDSALQSLVIKNLRVANIDEHSKVRLTLTPVLFGYDAVNNTSDVGCVTDDGDSVTSQSPDGLGDFHPTADVPVYAESQRIAGMDRYDTARLIAKEMYPFIGEGEQEGPVYARAVVLANGENYKQGFDALSANYLAAQVTRDWPEYRSGNKNMSAPILLTKSNELPDTTANALRDVLGRVHQSGTGYVYVMGKQDSVSDAVVDQVKNVFASVFTNVQVIRVAGSNRYITSAYAATVNGSDNNGAEVGSYKFTYTQPAYKTAFLASGEVNADSLAAGPLSNDLDIPMLLTPASGLPTEIANVIQTLNIQQLIVLGGTDRVPDAVVDQAKAAGVKVVKRIAGTGNDGRFATAADLYTFARTEAPSPGKAGGFQWGVNPYWNADFAFLANGITGFPDALTVGPLAAWFEAPLLTTRQDVLPQPVQDFFTAQKLVPEGYWLHGHIGLSWVVGLGQQATIAKSVLDKANALLGWPDAS